MCRMIVCEEYGLQEDGVAFFSGKKIAQVMAGQGKGPKSQTCVSCLGGQVHLFWNRDPAIGYGKDEQVVISHKQIFSSFKTASSPRISPLAIPGYPSRTILRWNCHFPLEPQG